MEAKIVVDFSYINNNLGIIKIIFVLGWKWSNETLKLNSAKPHPPFNKLYEYLTGICGRAGGSLL